MDWGWIAFGVVCLAGAYGLWRLARSLRNWGQAPPGRDAEAQNAEARLWSTRNYGGGGGAGGG
ncbi:MAG TPA: hypothetical protein VHJ34_08565 [Actinomycetota bacterium]|nr:hypothetical protein [Actinomycetota bacterium]